MRLLAIPLFLILEILASIRLADFIGAWGTLAWLVGALLLGVNLLRVQGAVTMMNAAQEMRVGGQPGQALADGVVKAFAAILLIVPGILSDLLAFVLLVPQIRRLLFKGLLLRWAKGASFHSGGFSTNRQGNIYEHDGAANDPFSPAEPGKLPQDKPHKGDD